MLQNIQHIFMPLSGPTTYKFLMPTQNTPLKANPQPELECNTS